MRRREGRNKRTSGEEKKRRIERGRGRRKDPETNAEGYSGKELGIYI